MPVVCAFEYADASLRVCKDLASLLRKRHAAEIEFSKNIAKIAQSISRPQTDAASSPSLSFSNSVTADLGITKTTFWKGFAYNIEQTMKLARAHEEISKRVIEETLDPFVAQIKTFEAAKKLQLSKAHEHSKQMREAVQAMKKAKKDMESSFVNATDAAQNQQRGQQNPNMREKDQQKLSAKATMTQDRAMRARENYAVCEQIVNESEKDYYDRILPEIYRDLTKQEMDRLTAAKSVLERVNSLEIQVTEAYMLALKGASVQTASIDIAKDVEYYVNAHMTDPNKSNQDYENDQDMLMPIPGELKRGAIYVKRDEVSVNWKPRTAILREDDHGLYFYEANDLSKHKDFIRVRDASVHSYDTSFFGKPCFQIISHIEDRHVVYTCMVNSEAMRDDWVTMLRRYTYCCRICSHINNFNESALHNDRLVSNNTVKLVRSFWLRIIEAKDLHVPAGVRSLTPYCFVLFDDIKFARTTIKTSETPMWSESFMFNDISAHFSHLRIAIFTNNKGSKDLPIGYVSVNLHSLKSGVKSDLWHPVNLMSEEGATAGSLRIAYKLTDEHILPTAIYDDMLEAVTEPNFKLIKGLGRVLTQDREELAKCFLNILLSINREREGIFVLIQDEIMATDDPHIIFRGNTLVTKVVDYYMKTVGSTFLQQTLTPLIRTIYENNEACEPDPSRIEPSSSSSDASRKNSKRLLQFVNLFWEGIQRSMNTFPRRIIEIFAFIRETVSQRFTDQTARGEHIRYPAISGFLFLRFFCPAIISPHQFGLATEVPSGHVPRTLTLIAKILQNLANLTEMKDVHLAEANAFIRIQKDVMKSLLDKVSIPNSESISPANTFQTEVAVDVARHCEIMYRFFERIHPTLNAQNQANASSVSKAQSSGNIAGGDNNAAVPGVGSSNEAVTASTDPNGLLLERLLEIMSEIRQKHAIQASKLESEFEEWNIEKGVLESNKNTDLARLGSERHIRRDLSDGQIAPQQVKECIDFATMLSSVPPAHMQQSGIADHAHMSKSMTSLAQDSTGSKQDLSARHPYMAKKAHNGGTGGAEASYSATSSANSLDIAPAGATNNAHSLTMSTPMFNSTGSIADELSSQSHALKDSRAKLLAQIQAHKASDSQQNISPHSSLTKKGVVLPLSGQPSSAITVNHEFPVSTHGGSPNNPGRAASPEHRAQLPQQRPTTPVRTQRSEPPVVPARVDSFNPTRTIRNDLLVSAAAAAVAVAATANAARASSTSPRRAPPPPSVGVPAPDFIISSGPQDDASSAITVSDGISPIIRDSVTELRRPSAEVATLSSDFLNVLPSSTNHGRQASLSAFSTSSQNQSYMLPSLPIIHSSNMESEFNDIFRSNSNRHGSL